MENPPSGPAGSADELACLEGGGMQRRNGGAQGCLIRGPSGWLQVFEHQKTPRRCRIIRAGIHLGDGQRLRSWEGEGGPRQHRNWDQAGGSESSAWRRRLLLVHAGHDTVTLRRGVPQILSLKNAPASLSLPRTRTHACTHTRTHMHAHAFAQEQVRAALPVPRRACRPSTSPRKAASAGFLLVLMTTCLP